MNKTKELQVTQPSVITPNQLLSQAISEGMELSQLEKLMDLQERWEKKEAEKAFNHAFSQFQANKPILKKTKPVSHDGGKTVKYYFCPLPQMQKQIDPVLGKFGLSYTWKRENTSDGKIRITCILSHVDGFSKETWEEADADTSGGKNAIQSRGSSNSYLKRYTLENVCGLSSEEDDDGEKSQLSKEEIEELQKSKLVELVSELDEELSEPEKTRLEQIIKKNEATSYSKAIKILKEKEEARKKRKAKEALKPNAK